MVVKVQHVKMVGSVFEMLHARMRHCLGESGIPSVSSEKGLTKEEHCRSNESSSKGVMRLLHSESSSVNERLLIPTLLLMKN